MSTVRVIPAARWVDGDPFGRWSCHAPELIPGDAYRCECGTLRPVLPGDTVQCQMTGTTDGTGPWLAIGCTVHGPDAAASLAGHGADGVARAWSSHLWIERRAADIARQTAERLAAPYSATCQADSGAATDCQPICTAPAVSRVIVETACYPVSVSDVCARHVGYVRGRAYPTPATVQPIPTANRG